MHAADPSTTTTTTPPHPVLQSRLEGMDRSSPFFFFLWSKSIFHETTCTFLAHWTSRVSACCRHNIQCCQPRANRSRRVWTRMTLSTHEILANVSFVINWNASVFLFSPGADDCRRQTTVFTDSACVCVHASSHILRTYRTYFVMFPFVCAIFCPVCLWLCTCETEKKKNKESFARRNRD